MNDHLRQYELSGSHYMFLVTLHKHRLKPGLPRRAVLYGQGNVARSTKRLRSSDISGETDPNDKRQNNLYLTDKGEAIVPYI